MKRSGLLSQQTCIFNCLYHFLKKKKRSLHNKLTALWMISMPILCRMYGPVFKKKETMLVLKKKSYIKHTDKWKIVLNKNRRKYSWQSHKSPHSCIFHFIEKMKTQLSQEEIHSSLIKETTDLTVMISWSQELSFTPLVTGFYLVH